MKRNLTIAGQSLFEVVVAVAISAFIIVGIVSLVSTSIKNSTFSKNKTVASQYAQEGTEWLRGQRDNNISTFTTNVLTPTWCISDLSWTKQGSCGQSDNISNTPFYREADFTIDLVNGKNLIQANVKVSWNDSDGYHEVTNVTNFSDWRQR